MLVGKHLKLRFKHRETFPLQQIRLKTALKCQTLHSEVQQSEVTNRKTLFEGGL